jgi:ribonucleoside-diphosphate reductase alpha chain
MRIHTFVKRDGSMQEFDRTKIDRWASYAARHGVEWKGIADKTIARLPPKTSSAEVHQTMIKVCLDAEDINHSRVAARLLYAQLRKDMADVGISDKGSFLDTFITFNVMGLWTEFEYSPEMEAQYAELYETRLEYWQIKQWVDKYGLKRDSKCIETAHMGALALGHSIFEGNPVMAFALAKAIITGKINLPTPVLNGVRNGDWHTVSCSVIEGGDSIDSIGAADHLAYMQTARKAGIGIRFDTRSIGDGVRNGAVEHLGKLPIYATVDKSVKMFTQVTRGGSATVTFDVYDPEVMEIIMVKSQRTPENKRIDKLDYSMSYDDAFLNSVMTDADVQTVSVTGVLGPKYKARDILKAFLTVRKETGRLYCINLTTANRHTPFIDPITQSNLCLEIALPTSPFEGMSDLYSEDSMGEMALCTLAAINVMKVTPEEYPDIALIAVATLNELINRMTMFTPSLQHNLRFRRSLGIGITGLAGYLYQHDKRYSDAEFIEELAERHYFYLLKSSQDLVGDYGKVRGIKKDWLPIDTKSTSKPSTLDWESLRGKPRCNSVLVAHMPTESSAVFSDSTNGLYPVRQRVITKASRRGLVQFIAPPVRETAWDIDNITLSKTYAAVQAYTDQSISADYYVGTGKISMSVMMKEWVAQARLGCKTMYYLNTNDSNGGTFSDVQDACEGACKL